MSSHVTAISDAQSYLRSRPDATPGDVEKVRALLTETGNDDLAHYFFGGDAA